MSSLDISLRFEALATFVLKKTVILCSRYILILVDLVISQSSNCLFSLICHLLTICQHVWWKWPLSLLPLLSEKFMAYHWTCALYILIGWLRKMTQLIKAVPLQIVEKAAQAVFCQSQHHYTSENKTFCCDITTKDALYYHHNSDRLNKDFCHFISQGWSRSVRFWGTRRRLLPMYRNIWILIQLFFTLCWKLLCQTTISRFLFLVFF